MDSVAREGSAEVEEVEESVEAEAGLVLVVGEEEDVAKEESGPGLQSCQKHSHSLTIWPLPRTAGTVSSWRQADIYRIQTVPHMLCSSHSRALIL